jgi:putative ABC transport system permease protein
MHDPISLTVSGIVDFQLDAEGQYTIACALPLLQQITNQADQDAVSVIMVRLKNSKDAGSITEAINREFPQLSAYTISGVVEAVDSQLSYFRQFSYILGGISLVVTFVLVFIITTISFHDRVGEIALLRAIGIGNRTIFLAVLFEGILTSSAAAVIGFGLGKIVALYLDKVLMSAPGLPADFSFFVFEGGAIFRALATLLLTGFFAGLYPASAAVRLPVAGTLREEIL